MNFSLLLSLGSKSHFPCKASSEKYHPSICNSLREQYLVHIQQKYMYGTPAPHINRLLEFGECGECGEGRSSRTLEILRDQEINVLGLDRILRRSQALTKQRRPKETKGANSPPLSNLYPLELVENAHSCHQVSSSEILTAQH